MFSYNNVNFWMGHPIIECNRYRYLPQYICPIVLNPETHTVLVEDVNLLYRVLL